MSYQEIKRISRGKKWAMVLLIIASVFMVFFKKVSRAQLVAGWADPVTQSDWTCAHNDIHVDYVFNNSVNGAPLGSNPINKCEPVTADLAATDPWWDGRLVYTPPARLCSSSSLQMRPWRSWLDPTLPPTWGSWGAGADCSNDLPSWQNGNVGEARYINGEKYTRAKCRQQISTTGYISCDSGYVKGEHAECAYKSDPVNYSSQGVKATADWKNEAGSLGGLKTNCDGAYYVDIDWANIHTQNTQNIGKQESPLMSDLYYNSNPYPNSTIFPVDLTSWAYRVELPPPLEDFCPTGSYCPGGCACACACDPSGDIIDCDSLESCLDSPLGHFGSLQTPPGQGKGVIRKPTLTATPFTMSPYLTCTGNQCSASASGSYSFGEQANATKYYGQCVDNSAGVDIKLEGDIQAFPLPSEPHPAVSFTVANRPPVVQIAGPASPVTAGDAVALTGTVDDPDDCAADPAKADKISQVKWTCVGSAGGTCSFKKGGVDQGTSFTDPADASTVSGPYQSLVDFVPQEEDHYTVTVEATDNDANNPMTTSKSLEFDVEASPPPSGEKPNECAVMTEDNINYKTLCDPPESVSFHTLVTDPEGSDNSSVKNYAWNCDLAQDSDKQWDPQQPDINGWTVVSSNENLYECDYQDTRRYTIAAVEIFNDNTHLQCQGQATVDVYGQNHCGVKAKNAGSSEAASSSISSEPGKEIQADIVGNCLYNTTFSFQADNGNPSSGGSGNTFTTSFPVSKSGYESIKGTIHNSKYGDTVCDEAQILLKEKLKFR